MGSVCCVCLGCPSEKASSFISVFIKGNLIHIIFCNSHVPFASFCMTDLPLWWLFFLCILQAHFHVYTWMFEGRNWNWPEKNKPWEVVWVSLTSLVLLWEVLSAEFWCLFTDWFGWFWGWYRRNYFSNFASALPFIARFPVTCFTNCLPISKLVW